MKAIALHDKGAIEAFLQEDPELHIYALGDLDPFFWPQTQWFGLEVSGRLESTILLYMGLRPPVVQALAGADRLGHQESLLGATMHLLPRRFYAHLSAALEDVLRPTHGMVHHGEYHRMALRRPEALDHVDTSGAERLTTDSADALLGLYTASYARHWFDPRMLQTNLYFGVRQGGKIVSVAGVHTFSPTYGVAALGNIATHPEHRRRGFSRAATAALCRAVRRSVDIVGLNVAADNAGAIACYQQLGFDVVHTYHEWTVECGASLP